MEGTHSFVYDFITGDIEEMKTKSFNRRCKTCLLKFKTVVG